jgi:hypothetical protein
VPYPIAGQDRARPGPRVVAFLTRLISHMDTSLIDVRGWYIADIVKAGLAEVAVSKLHEGAMIDQMLAIAKGQCYPYTSHWG